MKVVVHKAQPIGTVGTDDLEIIATDPIASYESLECAAMAYSGEAQRIADALAKTLPGGTFDHLVSCLLLKKVSHLIVSYE